MAKSFYLILLFVISYEQVAVPTIPNHPPSAVSTPSYIYLPMKKDHKYGDDICYYREYDEKLLYYIYYVRPCEKGKYCQKEVSNGQPFGYCVDILTNTTTISNLDGPCESNYECQNGLTCENSKCIKSLCTGLVTYQYDLTTFHCHDASYKQLESKYCQLNEYSKDTNGFYDGINDHSYEAKYPGLPNVCGKINYISVDVRYPAGTGSERDPQYLVESMEWCTIGSVPDNEFVDDAKYCNSGFTLDFFPNKQLKDPSKGGINTKDKMCVTPIEIDFENPYVGGGCIITYKIGEQSPKKYKATGTTLCSQDIIIKSERHREFAEAFNSASEEDKQNCYDIDTYKYRCKNVNLIKLWYFKQHPEDYLFYKDRKKLKKVLDYKIQKEYPIYSEFSQYLNYSYLLFLLILTIM